MPSILFVDDERNILSGLRRMLHGKRSEWDMTFSQSAEKAAAMLDDTHFDIVVSDLRMPGMDGVELLERVREQSPETVRIALSGYADRDATLRAVRQIHQFLAKPCEAETLTNTLERAIALSSLLGDHRLKELISGMDTVPSLPTLYVKVLEEIEAPDGSLAAIGDMIAQDVSMSAKVLQLVNSALWGLPQRITSPTQAVVLLGLDTMRVLVLTVKIFDQFDPQGLAGLSLDEVWTHSVAVASLAERIALAEEADQVTAENSFLAGLLHDVGKLILAANLPEKYGMVRRLDRPGTETTEHLERKVIGATHGEVGAYLLGLWGFERSIIESITYHRNPAGAQIDAFCPLVAVHVANALVHNRGEEPADSEAYRLERGLLERIGLLKRLDLWRGMCLEVLKKEDAQ